MTKRITGKERAQRMVDKAKQRRARALALYNSGKTQEEVGAHFRVSRQRAAAMIAAAQADVGQ